MKETSRLYWPFTTIVDVLTHTHTHTHNGICALYKYVKADMNRLKQIDNHT